MKQRLPLILSITALVVALLGWTGVGEATRNALVPKNSVGPAQIKKKAVKSKHLAPGTVKSKHLAPGTVFNLRRDWLRAIRRTNDRVSALEGGTAAPTSDDLADLESRVGRNESSLSSLSADVSRHRSQLGKLCGFPGAVSSSGNRIFC